MDRPWTDVFNVGCISLGHVLEFEIFTALKTVLMIKNQQLIIYVYVIFPWKLVIALYLHGKLNRNRMGPNPAFNSKHVLVSITNYQVLFLLVKY